MKLFNIHVIPCNSAGDFYSKFKKKMLLHTILEGVKLVFIVAIACSFCWSMLHLLPKGA